MLFKVKQNPKSEIKGELLGFKWIEVLAIEPTAIGNPDERYGEWCFKTISNYYICNTNHGLVRIISEDFWTAIEEYNENNLIKEKEKEKEPPFIIRNTGSLQISSSVNGDMNSKIDDLVSGNKFSAGQNINFNQIWEQVEKKFNENDLIKLSDELSMIRKEMKEKSKTPEEDKIVENIASAEVALKTGRGNKALEYLSKAGSWLSEVAKENGAKVLIEIIKMHLN